MRLIESYGTGIRKIHALYSIFHEQPRIEVTPNTFKMILPNMNATSDGKGKDPKVAITPPATGQEKAVAEYLVEKGEMTEKDIQDLLNVKKTRAYVVARKMREEGLIAAAGRGATKKHKLR